MSAQHVARLSPEEYLRIDRAADYRSEYVDGEMFAMSGGSNRHSFLITRLSKELQDAVEEAGCEVATATLRLQVDPKGPYFYPDLMVVCGDHSSELTDIVTNPILIVEVLSPSTERWDRTGKFDHYKRLKSLQQYVLVSQDEMRVEWFTRRADGMWMYESASGEEGVCTLRSINATFPLARLYRRFNIPPILPEPI